MWVSCHRRPLDTQVPFNLPAVWGSGQLRFGKDGGQAPRAGGPADPLHMLGPRKRGFAIPAVFTKPLPVASAPCKHAGPGPRLRNCGFGEQFQERALGPGWESGVETNSMEPLPGRQLQAPSCWALNPSPGPSAGSRAEPSWGCRASRSAGCGRRSGSGAEPEVASRSQLAPLSRARVDACARPGDGPAPPLCRAPWL